MSTRKTLTDSRSAISSQESADGPMRSSSPDGRTTIPSGLAPVPVSRFRAQDSEKAMPINATSGQLFNLSSPSRSLQWSLESKLRARMGASGSPLYVLTWRNLDMPVGVPILQRRALGLHISGNGSGGWLTPTVNNGFMERFTIQSILNVIPTGSNIGFPGQVRLLEGAMGKKDYYFQTSMISCLLMGFTAKWDDCAPMETPSSLKWQRNSSQPLPKR